MKFKDKSKLVVTPPPHPQCMRRTYGHLTAQVLNQTTSWPSAKTVNLVAIGFGTTAQRSVHYTYAGKAKRTKRHRRLQLCFHSAAMMHCHFLIANVWRGSLLSLFHSTALESINFFILYKGAGKSLARPGRKQSNVSVRMA